MSFPANFIWGAATSAYQIEGAATVEGRGASVWDRFCAQPGKVHGGHDGAIACDHYHRFESDVGLMQAIGLQAYRFSIAWPRVMPEGTGRVNEAGLAFYDRLVDALLEARIQPWVTLFHWDYPVALYRRGGWLNAESPGWFADYTRVVVDRLSDRVQHWITLNEPQCFVGLGHESGEHAPGDRLPPHQVTRVAHHALIAHGRAVQVIRERAKLTPKIGWAPTGDIPLPASDLPDDIAAARETYWAMTKPGMWNHAWWLRPVIEGCYPEDGLRALGEAAPKFTAEEMAMIREPLDFLGLNIYNGYRCRRAEDGGVQKLSAPAGHPKTQLGWNVMPAALRWGARFAHERSKLPIVITENGMASHDWVDRDGAVHDPQRIDYLARYLAELRQATADGVPVIGYFAWSLMDNFEWAEGYRPRFGLVHVDYATQKRTPKDSARWYAEVIRTNGANLTT
jgi:beta-glucosidase